MTKNPLLLALGAIGLLSALALVGAFAYTAAHDHARQEQAIATPKASAMPSVPVPALDIATHNDVWQWLGQDQVIATERQYGCLRFELPYYLVDLRTGSSRLLSECAPSSEGVSCDRSPFPSPDGKWLLYSERVQSKAIRWRLERVDSSATTFVPKAFVHPPPQSSTSTLPAWFPDSQRWIASDLLKPQVFLYDLANPNFPPRRIVVPFSALWSPTTDGHLVSYLRSENKVTFVSLKDSSTHSVSLIREHERKAKLYIERAIVSPDGKRAVVHYCRNAQEPTLGNLRGCDSLDKLTLVSLVDGSQQDITFDLERWSSGLFSGYSEFSLSPNGKTLLYWGKGGARRVDL